MSKPRRTPKRETLRVHVEGRLYEGARFVDSARPLRQEVEYRGLRRADPESYDSTDAALMRDMACDMLRELVREVEGASARRRAV